MNVSIVTNAQPAATLLIDPAASPVRRRLEEELRSLLRRLSGVDLPVAAPDALDHAAGALIAIGGPEVSPLAAQAEREGLLSFADLKPDGFVIHAGLVGGRPAIVLGGRNERADQYAVYELLERLGIVFQLTGDIIPETRPDLALAAGTVRMEPVLPKRGLHMRHFVMPWMGMDYFRTMLDQMAKLKFNYLEFFAYVGSPWMEYAWRGETKRLGDLYPVESGYTAWRCETGTFSTRDVVIGREHFQEERPCAPEFQHVRTQEEAYRTARALLREVIAYAHSRHIEIWIGKGDCPSVPANLARHIPTARDAFFGLAMIAPHEPAGLEIWNAMLDAMVRDYPEADGYWLWLAEIYFRDDSPAAKAALAPYEAVRRLIPPVEELRASGYDQYLKNMDDAKLFEAEATALHYAKHLIGRATEQHPGTRWGVSVLGRSYLLPALDAVLPPGVALQSMEAAVCWNRASRVPMENFGKVTGRELYVMPRLDDDESEFAMQFNVGLYHHDRVIAGSAQFGLAGAIPQMGRTRGLEQNARFLAEGGWDGALTPESFYPRYVERIFGASATPAVLAAYRILEANELYLGLEVPTDHGGWFQGMGNFLNYNDSRYNGWLARFRDQAKPLAGPDFKNWHVRETAPPSVHWFLPLLKTTEERFAGGVARLLAAQELLESARPLVVPGARHELEYLIYKTDCFRLHLDTLRALARGFTAYDAAFRARYAGETATTLARFDDCEFAFDQCLALAEQTARRVASLIDDPTEKHILFRYNVRMVLPLREFRVFIGNVVNFHRGQPYWQPVNWDIIAIRPAARM